MTRWNVCERLRPSALSVHPHRERRPILKRTQRAEVVRDALRQHRHDPVGEIDRVPALERLAIQGRAGADIGRDVGDRDGDDEPARILRVGIESGMDRVVVVLGVGRVHGDERQGAPILAGAPSRTGRALSASFSAAGEKTCGMRWVASAMRLTARSDLTEPIVSTTRAAGGPNRVSRRGSMATRSPSRASPALPAGTKYSRAAPRFSTGSARPEPSAAAR